MSQGRRRSASQIGRLVANHFITDLAVDDDVAEGMVAKDDTQRSRRARLPI